MMEQGFPILEAFKGVFIGPTINEIAAAVAGGTVGVMGTILALETGRQRAVERKQCPYCRKLYIQIFHQDTNINMCGRQTVRANWRAGIASR